MCSHYDFCLSVGALFGRKHLHCYGCPHEKDTAGQVWSLDDLAGCICLLVAVSTDLPAGISLPKVTGLVEERLGEIVAHIAGDRDIRTPGASIYVHEG